MEQAVCQTECWPITEVIKKKRQNETITSRKVEAFSLSNIRPFKLIKIIVIVHDTEVTVPIVIFTQKTPAKIMTQERNSKEIIKIRNKKVTKIYIKRKKIL